MGPSPRRRELRSRNDAGRTRFLVVAVAVITVVAGALGILALNDLLGPTSSEAAVAPRETGDTAPEPGRGATTDRSVTPARGQLATPSPGSLPPQGSGPAAWPTRAEVNGVPVRVSASAIDLDTPLIDLGTNADGSIEVPVSAADVGWLTSSAVPGGVGPAVLAGHVDSRAGPGVFYRLREMAAGDRVFVTLSDGAVHEFEVTRTLTVGKDEFPTQDVYGPVPDAQLRLITCGGEFDQQRRSYEDNVVVFASHVNG